MRRNTSFPAAISALGEVLNPNFAVAKFASGLRKMQRILVRVNPELCLLGQSFGPLGF